MKKLVCFCIFVLMLSACNIPAEKTPLPDLVGTGVAQALTNAPTMPSIEETLAVISTMAPPTEAPNPTATLLPTETPTQVPTFTPTIGPEDPAMRYGAPTNVDDYSSSTLRWDYEDDWFKQTIADGYLNIISKGTPYWNSWYTVRPEMKNFYVEATLTLQNCNGGDRIGLAFRLKNDQYYFMGITCSGSWGFYRYTGSGQVQAILEPQSSTKLNAVGQANRVGVLAQGDAFEFYINGAKVGATTDDSFQNAGTYGFVSMSAGTVNFKTQVDSLKIWQLP